MTKSNSCSKCQNWYWLHDGQTYSVACPETGIIHDKFCQCPLGNERAKEWRNEPETQETFDRIQKARVEKALRDSWVSPRFRFKRVGDLQDNKKLYETSMDYIVSWKEKKEEWKWLFFSWPPGTGKTHTATAIANELIDRHLTQVMFVSFAEVASRVKKTFDEKSEDSELFEKMKKSELLVLDDLGTEKWSEWIEEQVFLIINYRYEYRLPMIITSNERPWQLHYKDRIKSRLFEMTTQIGFDTLPDRRLTP